MAYVTVLSLLLTFAGIFWLKHLRRELIVAGLFSILPILAAPLLFSGALVNISVSGLWSVLPQLSLAVFMGVGGYAGYHFLLRRVASPVINPNRQKLKYLFWSIVLTGVLVIAGLPAVLALAVGVAVNIVVALLLRYHLVWETLFSGFGLGLLFMVTALIGRYFFPSLLDDLWQTQNEFGLTFLGLPLLQIAIIILLGLLLGPFFLAMKDSEYSPDQPIAGQRTHVKATVGLSTLVIVLSTAGLLVFDMSFRPQVVVANYQAEKLAPLNSAILLKFSRPVDRAAIKLSISPEIVGEWRFEDNILGSRWFNTLVFQPTEIFSPGETYTIQAADMRTMLRQESGNYTHTFTAEPPPTVRATVPIEKAENHEICEPITFSFNEAISDYWRPEIVFEPAAQSTMTKTANDYTVKPTDCLAQGTAYTATVTSQAASSTLGMTMPLAVLHFTTKPAPGIANYSPKGEAVVVGTSTIEISLTKAMKTDDPLPFLSISPTLAGVWAWEENGTRLRYTIGHTLAYGTKYSVTLKKGLPEAIGNGFLEETVVSFTTIGPVRISSVTPTDRSGPVHESIQPQIQFSQNVDHASAEERFSIEPPHAASLNWNGNRLTIKPNSNLGYETKYTLRVKAGVKSAQGGLDLAQDFISSFTIRFAPPVPIGFGYSEQGRLISGYVFGSGGDVILLFGAIHGGKEPSGARLLDKFIGELGVNPRRVSSSKTVVIIPISNPDGYFERQDKLNSRGVNLNRNFNTSKWGEAGWDTEGSIGSEPFSEAESRVIRSVVQRYGVGKMFAFHSQGNLVNPELGHAASQSLARQYASLSRYYYYEDIAWNFPGTATRWFVETVGGPAVTVELASHTVADWFRHQKALFSLVQ